MGLSLSNWMRPGDVYGQCVGLAGLFQSVAQVQACARGGDPDDERALRTSLESVLRIDAPDPQGVYGGIHNLRPGLGTLVQHLQRQLNTARVEQSRYAASLMFLERRLAAAPARSAALGEALHELGGDVATHGCDSPWMQRQLASLYVDHVSDLGPRIMVSGEPAHLKGDDNANRIRSLLLAGLRGAVLWRQRGGNRFKLIVMRSTLAHAASELLEKAQE